MFLVVTHHPPRDWCPEQREAAAEWGETVYLGFPVVPAEADAEHVDAMAAEMADDLTSRLVSSNDGPHAVLVAGEPTLCYPLIARLQARGVVCLTATSERHVERLPDGTERRDFRFVRFRPFPSLHGHPLVLTPREENTLSVTTLRVYLACETDVTLPPFAGFALYGALKQRAREVGCQWAPVPCLARCAQPEACEYGRLFQPVGPTPQRNGALPFALCLHEPRRVAWRRGETLGFDLRVIGSEPDSHLQLLRESLETVIAHGLGVKGSPPGTIQVEEITAEPLLPREPPQGPLTVTLVTPLRLRLDRAWVSPNDLDAHALIRACRSRDRALRTALGLPPQIDSLDWIQESIRCTPNLRWQRFRRASKNGGHSASGIVGSLHLDGPREAISGMSRLLVEAERLNLGSRTAMGLGTIRVETA
ncbi:MAG: hypothetical protein AAGI52_09470 [Bacteroidota bacterium]